jgi:hypothetical protein
MGGVFSKPKKPDTSEQDALIAKQQGKIKEQDSEIATKKAAKRSRSEGRASLISGSAKGIPSSIPTRTTTG